MSAQPWTEAGQLRRLVPVFAVGVAVVAALNSPSSPVELLLMAAAVAAFVAWAVLPRVPLWVLCPIVLAAIVAAQHAGGHEPLMFEASVLAFVVGGWAAALPEAVALGLLTAISPLVVSTIEDAWQHRGGDLDPRDRVPMAGLAGAVPPVPARGRGRGEPPGARRAGDVRGAPPHRP